MVAQACKEKGIPCIAIFGKVDADEDAIKASILSKLTSISDDGKDSFGNTDENFSLIGSLQKKATKEKARFILINTLHQDSTRTWEVIRNEDHTTIRKEHWKGQSVNKLNK